MDFVNGEKDFLVIVVALVLFALFILPFHHVTVWAKSLVCLLPTLFSLPLDHDSVSERLRRWTRNPLGSARRGSNPLAVVLRSNHHAFGQKELLREFNLGPLAP